MPISSINNEAIVLDGNGLADGSVTNAKLANNSVSTDKIENYAITGAKLAAASVGNSKLGATSVSTDKIQNGAVTVAKIGEHAVTGAKINDLAVSTRTMVDQSVTTKKIADGSVSDVKLDPNGVLATVGGINDSVSINRAAIMDNSLDLIKYGNLTNATSHGVSFAWEDGKLTADGTADGNALYRFDNDMMRSVIEGNNRYTIKADGVESGYIRLYNSDYSYSVYAYEGETNTTVPADVSDLSVVFIVPSGQTIHAVVSISILNAPNQRDIADTIRAMNEVDSSVGAWRSLPSVFLDWHLIGSTSYPSGFRRGGYNRSSGEATNSSHTIRTLDTVDPVHFVQNAEYIELAAPSGYTCEVYEYGIDGDFIKSHGLSYSVGETTESVFVKCVYGHVYKLVVGYWESWNDYYATDEFVSQIRLRVWYNPNQWLNSYYFPYIDGIVDKVNSRISSSDVRSFAFAFVTDYHFLRNANQTQKLLRYITDKTGVHTVVFGGDAFQNWKSLSESQRMINHVYGMLSECGGSDYWCMAGNHEWNDTSGQQNTQAGINAMTTNRVIGKASEIDQYGDYWFDNEVTSTRFFILSTNVSGSIQWPSILYLGNKLMDVPDGYNVMVIAHAGLLSQDGVPIMKNTYINVAKLLGAADRGESVSLYNSADALMGTFDYTGKDITAICYLCGHVHEDLAIEKSESEQGVLVVSTTGDLYKDANGNHYTFTRNGETVTRNVGTIYEQAFDVIVVDTAAKSLNMVRVGAGNDRTFSYA